MLLRLCQALVRTFPRDLRLGELRELPEVILRLVTESRADNGFGAAIRMAGREVAALAAGSVRVRAERGGHILRGLRTRLLSRVGADLRVLALLALRDRGGTIAFIAIVAIVSGATSTFVTLGNEIRSASTSVPTADRLGWIWADRTWEPEGTPLVSDAHLQHLREGSTLFDGLAALWMVSGRVTGNDGPVHADVARASANFFDLLTVRPYLGRLFEEGDDGPNAPWVAVLTYDFWAEHFDADPSVIGERIVVGVPEMEIVGVLPMGFDFPIPAALGPYGPPSVWLPTRHHFGGGSLPLDVQAVLSLRSRGVDAQELSAELARLGGEADAAVYGERGFAYIMQSLPSGRTPGLARALDVVAAALAAMLLVTLGNVFLLAKASQARKARTLWVLRLVGGTKGRLATILALEGMAKGLIGAVGGVSVAWVALRVIRGASALPDFVPRTSPELRVTVLVAASLAAVLSIAHGSATAWHALRAREALVVHRRSERTMIILQVALALVLVVGASVMDAALRGALTGRAGFQPDGLVTFTLYPMPDDYPDGRSRDLLLDEVERRLVAHPGIDAVNGASALPLSGGSTQLPASRRKPRLHIDPGAFSVAEWTGFDGALLEDSSDTSAVTHLIDLNVARPKLFASLGIPTVAGREFSEADSASTRPVTIIDQNLATVLWVDSDPLGDSLWVVGAWRDVVGVVPPTSLHGLQAGPRPQAWVPHGQVLAGRMAMVVETDSSPAIVEELAREVLAEIDREVPVGAAIQMSAWVRAETAEERFMSWIVLAFAAVSLALASFAIYGMLAGLVSARRKEIAVRLALGGTRRGLQLFVAGEGVAVVLAGSIVGGALYAAAHALLHPLAFVAAPAPPVGLYVGASALCLIVGAAAGLAPSLRVARTDPTKLLTGP